jgi:PAS domain S-box-containing protein
MTVLLAVLVVMGGVAASYALSARRLRTSELTSADARLRLSEERLRHALAVGRMGIWERDLRTEINTWDERLREILGVPREGVVDVQAWFFDRVPGEQGAQILAFVAAAEKGGPGYFYECQYQRPDGHWIWISMSGGPRVDENGVPTHLAGLTADITARKEAEAEFVRLTAELDQRVADRTRDLADSRRRLRALVGELTRAEERERRRLAAELHDTLTQTLTLSRMNVSRASRLLDEGADRTRVTEVLSQTQATLDSSIAYTRTLISELSPRVLYDFGLAVALQWLGDQMRAHGLQVTLAGDSDCLEVRDDHAVLVFQSVRELLWNVVKHAESPRAEVTWQVEMGELRVSVEDAGRGFSDVGSAQGGGFGLLSIRERVALQGGRFDVRSERGRGTRVTLRLPLDGAREEPGAEGRRPWIESSSKPIRVVLVDDHSMVREGLCRVLDQHHNLAIVGEAGDGLDAVELVERCAPDVVIMDVNLPRINGIEATRRILDRSPGAIVIGISSGADEFVIKAMKGAGAVTCLMKERAVEDLYRAIDDAVASRLHAAGVLTGPAGAPPALHESQKFIQRLHKWLNAGNSGLSSAGPPSRGGRNRGHAGTRGS